MIVELCMRVVSMEHTVMCSMEPAFFEFEELIIANR